ncbi:protein of unknown function [Actinopolyspora mzabensis]|uniref:DUF397 domain-containing protein n=1 Tax=Actinopolyspora mzabensis TaxID=995066 RepID=A0A1G9DYB9_ACTMZ|nr:DUF397 domain-containing protein [Actinopolyspora mzabensis]SDK68800.1 protein of unknown function [Actinopolyspora mzabensis]
MSAEQHDSDWFVSSYSGGNNNSCVEVRFTGHGTEVRDTKNRAAATLTFGAHRWNAFLRALRG